MVGKSTYSGAMISYMLHALSKPIWFQKWRVKTQTRCPSWSMQSGLGLLLFVHSVAWIIARDKVIIDMIILGIFPSKHILWVLAGIASVIYTHYYTPDIRSMWGYIVFAFPFVCSSVRSFVRTFVLTFIRSSFRHRVKVFALKFIRPHILKILWWI